LRTVTKTKYTLLGQYKNAFLLFIKIKRFWSFVY